MDCFNNLPDDVLCHILSFLTTKEAALTSVLSTRWRNLIAFVPNLVIDASVSLHCKRSKRERCMIPQSFMDFVDRVLVQHGVSTIKKFSLKCNSGVGSDRMNRWICNVLQRGVSDLELFIESEYYDSFHKMFIHKTRWWPGPNSPMLKTLVVDPSWIFSDKLETILMNFPALQELDLGRFQWMGLGETVSSTSLKKLTIKAYSCEKSPNPKTISFDTPNLLYLKYSDFVSEDYPKLNMANVVEASLNLKALKGKIKVIRGLPNDEDEDEEVSPCQNVWKLMSAIRNVQKLSLFPDTLEVISLCCESIPVFNNLKWLKIQSYKRRGWQAVPVLVQRCPHLETLVLEGLLHYVTDKCGDACDCISREDKGRSLRFCPLKKIQIHGFRGTKREMGIIKHFLESFPCLKEMEIHAEKDDLIDCEVPVNLEHAVKILKLYNELSSCDVRFLHVQ